MNGAESLLLTLANNGVDVCFLNPGTSEMHFVAALDHAPGLRCVLCLQEGVASGAADGYARMSAHPASTLLHLGPGLGNALANLHNAKKGQVPVVNIVGDHASYHLQYDAPLTSDIEGIARAVSSWVHTSTSADSVSADAAQAVSQARRGNVATLVLPADASWGESAAGPAGALSPAPLEVVSEEAIGAAAQKMAASRNCMILVGGRHISSTHSLLLAKIAAAVNARVCTEVFPARLERGAGRVELERLPYLAESAIEYLKEVELLVLIGASAPVSFFAYPGVASEMAAPNCEMLPLAGPDDDIDALLEGLVACLGAAALEVATSPLQLPEPPTGELDVYRAAQALAHYLPENAIVVDESATSGVPVFPQTATARPHDWLNLTGGSIGWGLPAAVGAAIACPERKVICLEGDGSAMYTIQALWTMARENLDILVVLYSNRKYGILELEFSRTGAAGGAPGPKAASTLSLGDPDMDFVALAAGMGVNACRADTAEAFNRLLQEGLERPGPYLLEAVVPPLF